MNNKILNHYLRFSSFTNPGCYKRFLQELPDDIEELGLLIRKQIIHRTSLKDGNTGTNSDLKYGDMNRVPWWRLRCEDDILTNAVSMISELLRLDDQGFLMDRKTENKIIVTCRFVSILMASVLKSKGIPARVRSGFIPIPNKEGSWDHWINQYYDSGKDRWITIDVDGSLNNDFNSYDVPNEKFDWAAETWLGIREGKLKEEHFINAGGFKGLMPVSWSVFYDFHSLMNNEILYMQAPYYIHNKFNKLTEKDFKEIDDLALLLLDPDKNFDRLLEIWNSKKKFRILNSPLISDESHVRWK